METKMTLGFKNWIDLQLEAVMCPDCGGPLALRNSDYGEFYGCRNYPRCKGKRSIGNYKKAEESESKGEAPPAPIRRGQRVAPQGRVEMPADYERNLPGEPVREPQRPQRQEPEDEKIEWFYAQTVKDCQHFPAGKDLALLPLPNGSWNFRLLSPDPKTSKSGVLSKEEVGAGLIKAYRDEAVKDAQGRGTPLKSENPSLDDLYQKLGKPMPHEEVDEKWVADMRKKHIIPLEGEKALSDEQRKIDERFDEIVKESQQSHIMIDAKAGTGKTTMLKHLAWKYGKPGQRWLYLVFNTKNKVEAKGKFPPWVHVATTNGFLGEVMGLPQNHHLTTKRASSLKKKFGKAFDEDEKVDKSELLANGDKFINMLKKFGFPIDVKAAAKRGGRAVGFDEKGTQILEGFIERSILDFQRNVITFVGLAKSFAIDPRKPDLNQQLAKIYDSYGPLPQDPTAGNINADMANVKASIAASKSERWKDEITEALSIAFGRNYMSASYEKEMFECVKWMLTATLPPSMPGATEEHVHVCSNKQCGDVWVGEPQCPQCGSRKMESYPLRQYRDFNDDFWFSAIFANDNNAKTKVTFPKYDYVLADEVQDFNECQKILLVKLHERGAKIVAVGDPFQGIYRFRGADSQAFKNLGTTLGDLSHNKDVTKTLTKNFRSRQAPLDWVRKNTIVKELAQGRHVGDPYQGDTSHGTIKYNDVFTQFANELKSGGMKKQTAFISRTNEPLAHAALKLLIAGIPFVIIGKDIAGGLKKHIKTVMNHRNIKGFYPLRATANVDELKEKAKAFLEQENNKFRRIPVKQPYLKNLDEVTNALVASIDQFIESLKPKPKEGEEAPAEWRPQDTSAMETIDKFTAWIGQKLGGLDWEGDDETQGERDYEEYQKKIEDKNTVILTTAHKSKGLEYERVYILRYDQYPHPKAKRQEDKDQEENARYVSGTRAMDELHIVQLEGQPGYNK